MIEGGRHNILGIRVDAVDYEAAVARIVRSAHDRQPLAVSALAVHGVMTGVLDAVHRYRLNRLDLVVPDGQPVRWALNWLHGARLADRVYGPTLMLKTCEAAAAERLPVFLFGGTAELLDELERRLCASYPLLRIAGKRPSKFRQLTSDERDDVVCEIRGSGAAMTMIGLGCPRQEVWAYEFRDRLPMPLLAVGAAFNFHAGQLAQAPPALQRRGLEWAWRLCREPRRLWKRYLLLNPLYASLLLLQWTGLRNPDPNNARIPDGEVLYG